MLALIISAISIAGAITWSLYIQGRLNKTIEMYEEKEKAKAAYDEAQSIINNRDFIERLSKKVANISNEISYVKNENGSLAFYDKNFDEIVGNKELSLLIDNEKHLDGQLYWYDRVYKVGKDTKDDLFSNGLAGVPSEIASKLSLTDETKFMDNTFELIGSTDGKVLPFDGTFFDKEYERQELYCKVNSKVPEDFISRKIATTPPSSFLQANVSPEIKTTCLYVEESLIEDLRKTGLPTARLQFGLSTREEFLLRFSLQGNNGLTPVTEYGKAWYSKKIDTIGSFDHLALSLFTSKHIQELNESRAYRTTPNVKVKLIGEELHIYAY